MDFSQFATPTPEWLEYARTHPPPSSAAPSISPHDNESLTKLRNASNLDRSKWSAQKLIEHDLVGQFITRDHLVPTQDGNSIPLRFYYPKSKFSQSSNEDGGPVSGACCSAFIHIHGGGFLNGSLDTETYICAAIAVKLGIVVAHPEYRHTNDVSFPVPHDDVWDAFQWIHSHCSDIGIDPSNMVVGGQSAGSGMAASLVQREVNGARQEGRSSRIKGQVLTIPWLAHPLAFDKSRFLDESVMSTTQCANAVGLSTEKLRWFASLLGAEDVFSEKLNPGLKQGSALEGIPKAAFLVAGGDPLRDQGLLYAKNLEDAG
ncbi:hypothetical protein KVR01_013296 [Diaporthe batatas]|uniref:uncharacterized protein n=1 Tax=Diaporthe batatas TaxID=748121 RepID=UPI001D03B800|nr:uncharacterized protein KVR01_013296 [Diaporthe batatas]KAG8156883.1 hypothetical protein KVR01_013296 [Diaporthe batatas]